MKSGRSLGNFASVDQVTNLLHLSSSLGAQLTSLRLVVGYRFAQVRTVQRSLTHRPLGGVERLFHGGRCASGFRSRSTTGKFCQGVQGHLALRCLERLEETRIAGRSAVDQRLPCRAVDVGRGLGCADTLALMREEGASECAGVMHCFTEDWETARASLDLGFYISFSGIVTFKSAAALREVAKKIPLDRILVETDAPYLAPVPHRGKRNEPAMVVATARFLADWLQLDFDEFSALTDSNCYRLFKRLQPLHIT
ncbi:MAG: TatD family deoxyribonuclease [Betaproteobacteria bacterium]|nr:TatD family deoxyribonuclease [Betaproteobacteria bacterium]